MAESCRADGQFTHELFAQRHDDHEIEDVRELHRRKQ